MNTRAGVHRIVVFAVVILALTASADAASVTVGLNFTGTTFNGFIPPDTMGAVGPDHLVELINGTYAVYDKSTGTSIATSTLNSFWSAAGAPHRGSFAFDPRVVYDAAASRWFAVAVDNPGSTNRFLVAVSNTSDPTDGWKGFAIDSDQDGTASHWADFPTIGYDADALYVAANMFPITSGSLLTNVLVLPKSDLLLAVPTVSGATLFANNDIFDTGFAIQPVIDLDGGGLPASFLGDLITSSGRLRLTNMTGTAASPIYDVTGPDTIVPAFSGPPDAAQPGAVADLETNDTRFSGNAVLVNGEIWAVQAVASGGRAAIRWLRLDPTTETLIESGVISDASLDLFFPSIAVNEFGDVVVGFSGSGAGVGQYASTYAAIGKSSGGVTTFGAPLLLEAGVADYQRFDTVGRNRWGDYSATVVDPTDPHTFWTYQLFASATNTWAVQITELRVDATVIPEPGSMALLGLGLGGVMILVRRSRTSRR